MYIDMDFYYALEFLLCSGIFLTYNEMFYAAFEKSPSPAEGRFNLLVYNIKKLSELWTVLSIVIG